jgi:serine/threonine protein kinase
MRRSATCSMPLDLRRVERSKNFQKRCNQSAKFGQWNPEMNIPTPMCVRCGAALPTDYPASRPCERCLLTLGLMGDEAPMLVHTRSGSAGPSFPSIDDIRALHPDLEIKEVLGEGGMGMVFRARQRDLDRDIALKVLRTDVTADSGFAERFEREARTMARLTHSNIVNVHSSGHKGSHYFLIMELVDGSNLRQVISRGELKPEQALAIIGQICDALTYAHGQGVVHRDIKPENILLNQAGQIKIVDFGLAKIGQDELAGLRLTRTDQAMGTPQYMAPEQIERPLEVDHRADIYSMGVVFYELLTGELPMGRFPAPSSKAEVSARLDEVVYRTLEKEPAQRYQSAAEVKTDIEGVDREAPPSLPRREQRSSGANHAKLSSTVKGWLLLGLIILGCMFVCGFLSLLLGVRANNFSSFEPSDLTPVPPHMAPAESKAESSTNSAVPAVPEH